MKIPMKVVVLSDKSILVDGVINRLKENQDRVELHVLDIHTPNLLGTISEIQPGSIIVNDKDSEAENFVTFDSMLRALPDLKIIRLNTGCLHTQLIRSEQYWLNKVQDLLELIDPIGL